MTFSGGSLAVTFSSSEGFQAAIGARAGKGDLVFTNHKGGCDDGVEPAAHLVNQVAGDAEKLMLTASPAQKNITTTASHALIDFQGIPAATQSRNVSKCDSQSRGVTFDDKGLTIGGSVGLPAGINIYWFPLYLSVTANQAQIQASVTFLGKIDYDIFGAKLKRMYVTCRNGRVPRLFHLSPRRA